MPRRCRFAWQLRAELKHQYTFDNDVGTIVQDSISGAHGTVVDAGSTPNFSFESGQLILSSNPNERSDNIVEGAYIDLPNGIVSSAAQTDVSGAVLFVWQASVSEVRTWSRFGDFGTSDDGEDTSTSAHNSAYIMVTPNSGRVGADGLEMTNHVPGSTFTAQDTFAGGTPRPFGVNVERYVTAVYDHNDHNGSGAEFENGTMSLYLNSRLVDKGGISPDLDLRTFNDNNNWLGRSQWPDALLAGALNEFRIYDHALTADEVREMFFVPEPSSVVLAAIVLLVAARRQFGQC